MIEFSFVSFKIRFLRNFIYVKVKYNEFNDSEIVDISFYVLKEYVSMNLVILIGLLIINF